VPYSYVQYAGSGTTGPFTVSFPYLLQEHVKLYRGLDLLAGTYTQLLVSGTDYTWTSGTQVQLTSALVNGTTLTIRRETPTTTRLVDWSDGSNLNAADMDTADLQNFYAIQDQQDKNEVVTAAGITTAANATAALNAVNAALPYAAIGTVAGIPAGTNGARIEVANSTGIEAFSPLAGRPAGFVGSSQIRVRLTYTTAGSTWNWVDYAVADPDGRYVRQSNISSSVSSTSTTTVAASAAVKTAKDAADAAQSTANSRAPLASPTFTGTVTIPAGASISGFAPLASPTFTGTPAAPTATAGTNTTQLATTAFANTAAANASLPLGAVIPFAGATAPAGWLKANGDTLPNGSGTVQGITADFSALYAIVGATYGAAGRLPDLRGEFVRGWDDGRGVDAGRVRGLPQTDLIKQHYHNTVAGDNGGNNDNTNSQAQTDPSDFSQSGFNTRSTGWDGANYLGGETRPRNIALLYCIKYTFFLTT